MWAQRVTSGVAAVSAALYRVVCVDILTELRISFFVQAADGIRDLYVTGVQTCALPISRGAARGDGRGLSGDVLIHRRRKGRMCQPTMLAPTRVARAKNGAPRHERAAIAPHEAFSRSEERRVGKEGGSPRPPARRRAMTR